MLSLDRQWRQNESMREAVGGASDWHVILFEQPDLAPSSPQWSIKQAIQERLIQTLTHTLKREKGRASNGSHNEKPDRDGFAEKTVLPLFAGPLQKRQWSGENLWTSCSSTNVRHILFMSFPLLMYVMNLLYWMHFMISIGLAWLESTGMMTALLQCVKHACFLSTSCSESLNERSIEHGQWLS